MSIPTARHLRWEELPADSPMEQLLRRRIVGSLSMLSHVTLEKGCNVPSHSHHNEQFTCVVEGALELGIGEEGTPDHHRVTVRAGEVLHLPPHVPHSARAIENTVVLDVFSPPSEGTGIDAAAGA